MIKRIAERTLNTKFGPFTELLYYDGQRESIALAIGAIAGREEVLCRIHSACIGGHVFNSTECDCAAEMSAAQEAVQKEAAGIIIYLDQEGKGNGHLALMESIKYKKDVGQAEAYVRAGFRADARDYRPAAEILRELRIGSIILMSGSDDKADELSKLGVKVVSRRGLAAISDHVSG